MIEAFTNEIKPRNGSYILGNKNHIGYYCNGWVYFFGFTEVKGYPRKARLKYWCDKWLYLKPCVLASEDECQEIMGETKEFEHKKYVEILERF